MRSFCFKKSGKETLAYAHEESLKSSAIPFVCAESGWFVCLSWRHSLFSQWTWKSPHSLPALPFPIYNLHSVLFCAKIKRLLYRTYSVMNVWLG